ncbi:hypothetical protein QJS66_16190 [Kocuria rhizophila]|nr:hypothetical protein QJS66_16190 [Kocuria rhizophila]
MDRDRIVAVGLLFPLAYILVLFAMQSTPVARRFTPAGVEHRGGLAARVVDLQGEPPGATAHRLRRGAHGHCADQRVSRAGPGLRALTEPARAGRRRGAGP